MNINNALDILLDDGYTMAHIYYEIWLIPSESLEFEESNLRNT